MHTFHNNSTDFLLALMKFINGNEQIIEEMCFDYLYLT